MLETHLLTLDESIEVAVGVMTPYRFTNTWVGVTGPLDAGYGPGTEREFSLIVAVPSDGRNAHNDVLRRIGEAASPAIEGYLGAHGVRYHLDLGVGFGRQVLVTPIDTVTGGARFHVVFTVSVAQVRAPLMEHPAPRL